MSTSNSHQTQHGSGITLRLGQPIAAVVVAGMLILAAAWHLQATGEASVFFYALAGAGVGILAQPLTAPLRIDVRVDGDGVVIARRRIWQPRFAGRLERIPRNRIQGISVENEASRNARGEVNMERYQVILQLRDGQKHSLMLRPERRQEPAEAYARAVRQLLDS